jgi:C4-dicarboxylate transporter DctQ subunit
LNRFFKTLNYLEEFLMATLLAVMTLLTSLQVLLRYAFSTGMIWSLEATTYCFAWLVLIGMSYCVRTQSHIALDLLVKQFKSRWRRLIGIFAIMVCIAYSLLMFYGSFIFVQRLYWLGNDARDLPIARWILTIILPIGFALLTLRFVQLGLAIWRGEAVGLGMIETKPEDLQAEMASLQGDAPAARKPGDDAS